MEQNEWILTTAPTLTAAIFAFTLAFLATIAVAMIFGALIKATFALISASFGAASDSWTK